MPDYLVFQLYGPIQSWGDIAVGEQRPSQAHPTKSAVLGLVAAALGIKRDEEARLHLLNQAYGFAVRVESAGVPLRDYHTIQTTKDPKKGIVYRTRRDELCWPDRKDINTILSSREYWMDAYFAVALWPRGPDVPHSLEELKQALQQPHFVLYLGRKSCPPALPLRPEIKSAENVQKALLEWKPDPCVDKTPRRWNQDREYIQLYWEDESATPSVSAQHQPQHRFRRNDQLLSRKRWQYQKRDENHRAYPRPNQEEVS